MEKFIVAGLSALMIVALFFVYDLIKAKLKKILSKRKDNIAENKMYTEDTKKKSNNNDNDNKFMWE